MKTQEVFNQSRLTLELRPIGIKKMIYLKNVPGDIFAFENKLFARVLKKNDPIGKEILVKLLEQKHHTLYVSHDTYNEIQNIINTYLIKMTRTLSQGDPNKKAPAQMNLMTINMANIYENTGNSELLKMQHQSSILFGKFLIDHNSNIDNYYRSFVTQGHHYTLTQPMLSSLLLIGFLAKYHLFSLPELENLYLTSYFKDVGMGLLASERFDHHTAEKEDKDYISQHAQKSVEVLRGRIPLEENQLNLIAHHHEIINKPEIDNVTYGFESLIVSITDIITAMLSERPYRQKFTLYETLEYIKNILGDRYFSEFKLLVHYLRNFFK